MNIKTPTLKLLLILTFFSVLSADEITSVEPADDLESTDKQEQLAGELLADDPEQVDSSELAENPELVDKNYYADWEALYEQRTQKAGKQIYEEAIALANSDMADENLEEVVQLLFRAAEICRDLNDVKHAITLFEMVIERAPQDPNYRRVYGDYLIGYRGLEEQAWAQFYKAREFGSQYSEKVDDAFVDTLNRSIHIFRRDTRDGALTPGRSQSDGALVFEDEGITITGGFDTIYGKVAKDSLDLSTDYYRAIDFFNVNGYLGNLPGNNLNALDQRLDRQVEASETLVSLLFRTPNSRLPAIRLSYFNTYAFESSLNFDGLDDPFDFVNDSLALELEKTFVLKNDLFLEADAALDYENLQQSSQLFDIENHFLFLTSALNFRQEWGTSNGSVSLNVGGSYRRDLYDFEAYPRHEQAISLRNLSFFTSPAENYTNERFRGRRSSGQEIGLIRSETREGSPDEKVEDWRFFISNQELGLIDGKLDVYTTYTYRERNLVDTTYGEGSYSLHQFLSLIHI